MSIEELPGTNNPAEVQGRIESGNKNNLEIGSADIYKLVLEGKIIKVEDLKRFSN